MISQKALENAFPGKGKELRALLTGKKKTKDYESVKEWMNTCYNEPDYIERLEYALNEILEGYGAEGIFSDDFSTKMPLFTYINLGDTYCPTLIRDYVKENWIISSMGDMVEMMEKRGYKVN